jgi:hypothetical protein
LVNQFLNRPRLVGIFGLPRLSGFEILIAMKRPSKTKASALSHKALVAQITKENRAYFAKLDAGKYVPEGCIKFAPSLGKVTAFQTDSYHRSLAKLKVERRFPQPAPFAAKPTSVFKVPQFVAEPLDARIAEGGSARFTAKAVGFPNPTYQWFSVDRANNALVLSGETNPELVVSNPALGASRYIVSATNGVGSAQSRVATLSVEKNLNLAQRGKNEVEAKSGIQKFRRHHREQFGLAILFVVVVAVVVEFVFFGASISSDWANKHPPAPKIGFDRFEEYDAAKKFIQAQYPGAQSFSSCDDSKVVASYAGDGYCSVTVAVSGVNRFNAPIRDTMTVNMNFKDGRFLLQGNIESQNEDNQVLDAIKSGD